MAYIDDDTSQHDGEPIELYTFVTPTGTERRTGHTSDVTIGPDTWTAIPLTRSRLAGASVDDPPTLEITMPASDTLVQDFAFKVAPRYLDITITRLHTDTGDTITLFKGSAGGPVVEGRMARFRVPSRLAVQLAAPVPSVYFQSQCNHVLFDGRCALSSANYDFATTVQTVQTDGVSIELTSTDSAPLNYYKAGEIVRDSDGERRLILSQSGNAIVINFPFPNLDAGDAVTIFAGCDHTTATCASKFSNIANFGGHPLIPGINPFATGLK